MVRSTIELRILSLFTGENLFKAFSISEIARETKAAYPHTHSAIKKMIADDILCSYNLGNSVLCAPNLENDTTRALLCMAHSTKNHEPNIQNLHQDLKQLAIHKPDLIAVTLTENGLHMIVVDEKAGSVFLKELSYPKITFSTPDAFAQRLVKKQEFGEPIVGYDRLLLSLAPYREEIMFRGEKHE